ncbi:MAG: hypothetical protein M0030_21735, partial [Actinomycetota bacterium]|nr:hypothetical protein [Actinomycetota bacterium]
MDEPAIRTRRAFLGTAAGTAGVVATGALAGCTSSPAAHPVAGHTARPRRATPSTVAENRLPGERHWWLKHIGAPDAIMGYTGQASVRRGEPLDLYVSTTAREFRVNVLRMGWYGGLLA